MAPRRMRPRRRRRKAKTDVPETEEGRPRRRFPRRRKAKTDVAEMDVPETEGVFFKALCQVLVNVTHSSFGDECMGQAILSVWLMIAVLCLCNLCGLVPEWFNRQTNLQPAG